MHTYVLLWVPIIPYISGQSSTAGYPLSVNVRYVWGLIWASKIRYFSRHGEFRFLYATWRATRPVYCKYGVCSLRQVTARARILGDDAIAGIVVWCWCCCGLAARTRAQKLRLWPLGRWWYVWGQAVCTGLDFRPSHKARNTTRLILFIQGGHNATPGVVCWATLCGGDCPSGRSCNSGISLGWIARGHKTQRRNWWTPYRAFKTRYCGGGCYNGLETGP